MPRITRPLSTGSAAAVELDADWPNDLASVDRRLDEVHRRRADEAGDEQVARLLVEPLRRVDLQDAAVAHDRDALPERHRLDLVVRDVDRRDAELLVELRERRAHADAELRVEVRERLVHEERLRLAHDRAPHRDALALPPESCAGLRSRSSVEAEQLARSRRPRADLGLRHRRTFRP
jgi:hypothetical protein